LGGGGGGEWSVGGFRGRTCLRNFSLALGGLIKTGRKGGKKFVCVQRGSCATEQKRIKQPKNEFILGVEKTVSQARECRGGRDKETSHTYMLEKKGREEITGIPKALHLRKETWKDHCLKKGEDEMGGRPSLSTGFIAGADQRRNARRQKKKNGREGTSFLRTQKKLKAQIRKKKKEGPKGISQKKKRRAPQENKVCAGEVCTSGGKGEKVIWKRVDTYWTDRESEGKKKRADRKRKKNVKESQDYGGRGFKIVKRNTIGRLFHKRKMTTVTPSLSQALPIKEMQRKIWLILSRESCLFLRWTQRVYLPRIGLRRRRKKRKQSNGGVFS